MVQSISPIAQIWLHVLVNLLLLPGQNLCSSITNIIERAGLGNTLSERMLFNMSGTPCIRCLDRNGHFHLNTMYFRSGMLVTTGSDIIVTEGVLVILNPAEVIPVGPLIIHCQSLPYFVLGGIHLFSNSKPCLDIRNSSCM